ncbi:MAG TPA: hypothetical protein VJ694_00310 [Patescibacteria group bacterium]|nr:hypothetical protein [Patescibacteria group bacterium]
MRHNTKTHLWTIGLLASMAWPALADGPKALDVTVDDLLAAGVAGVTEVAPAGDRFAPPMRYFRSSEKLSDADARKDCADCADLIAVYAADVATVPGWTTEKIQQFQKVGSRLQLRTYIPATRRVVTVTAVSEATMRKISAQLVAKFSK